MRAWNDITPEERLAVLGVEGMPDGVYKLRLKYVAAVPGGMLVRWDLVEAPGFVYEEVEPLADEHGDCT